MRKITILAIAALSTLPAAVAEAGSLGRPCTSEPHEKWLPLATLQGKIEALGYKVQKSKLKKSCGELYVLDAKGSQIELFVDPVTGTIVGQH